MRRCVCFWGLLRQMTTCWEAYKQQKLTSPSCGGQNSEIRVSAGLFLRTGGSEGGGVLLGSSGSWRLPAVFAVLGLWPPCSHLCLRLHTPLPLSVSLSVSYKDIRVELGHFLIQNGLSWISILIPSTRTLIQSRTLRFQVDVNVGGCDSAPSGVYYLYAPGEMKGTERDAQRGGVTVAPLFMVRAESEAVCLPTVCGAPASSGARFRASLRSHRGFPGCSNRLT